jgi:hypothetical protein
MKTRFTLLGLATLAAVVGLGGCGPSAAPPETVAEGIIYYVQLRTEGDRIGGFTRVNDSKAVPGGNGSWNVDAYGKLTRDFLIVTRPQHKELGPQVIPVNRLVEIQFGDGGIKTVNENQSAPAK